MISIVAFGLKKWQTVMVFCRMNQTFMFKHYILTFSNWRYSGPTINSYQSIPVMV